MVSVEELDRQEIKFMRVGILGTGLMGGPMAMRLQQSGHRVKAWNRSADNLAPLAQVGIETAPTAAAVLTSCEVTITMFERCSRNRIGRAGRACGPSAADDFADGNHCAK